MSDPTMQPLADGIARLYDRAQALLEGHAYLQQLITATLTGLALYGACVTLVLLAEAWHRRGVGVYRSRTAFNDLAYMVFYRCSIYALIAGPVYGLLMPRLQMFRLQLFHPLHPIAGMLAAWLMSDFLRYWTHRLQHTSAFLWAFHSVHHAPTELNLFTANRIHAGEQLAVGLLLLVPGLIFGIPAPLWLPVVFLQTLIETMSHARLPWTFGPLARVLVSPALHAVHHSAEARDHHRNFAGVFSIWDVLFGTFAEPTREQPLRFGVEGMHIPERLTSQFLHPLRMLFGAELRRPPAAEEEPVSS
jgi:sterol desaturase/sphingolipid hydroxylase (fatty acid hydroxylase superfamily)